MRVFKGRNPFGALFGSSRKEDFVVRYVLREHARGRALAEVLDDAYVRNWSRPEERARLLDRPDLVAALGANALEEVRAAVRGAEPPSRLDAGRDGDARPRGRGLARSPR
jgi:hypothetical protein